MPKEIKLVADNMGILTSIIWISLQDDGSISIGMSDRTFLVPGFTSRIEIDGAVHQNHVHFEGKLKKKAITNPHFTFHPPMYVHLRANNEEELFAGVLGVDFIVEAEGCMPWIRFVSSPIKELKPFIKVRDDKDIEIVRLLIPSNEISLGIGVDFVSNQVSQAENMPNKDYFISWHGRTLHVFAQVFSAQKSTVQWNHDS
ncbi:MAG: hypothetical protein HS100_22770 [Anaerolineales bacterium]|nr:hypothetical protein [Anaerolineales bacterium]